MMIHEHKSDPYIFVQIKINTIAELYNIHEEDPWDKRADEVKADEKLDKVYSPPVQGRNRRRHYYQVRKCLYWAGWAYFCQRACIEAGERKKEELDDASKKGSRRIVGWNFRGDVAEPDDVEDETIEEDSKFAQFFKVAVMVEN